MRTTIEVIIQWTLQNRLLLQGLGIVSIIMFIASPVLVSVLVINIPDDYFLYRRDHFQEAGKHYHPVIWAFFILVKNVTGLMLVFIGILMLVLPGQGIITILVGLILIDFPYKRRMESWIVRQKRVLTAINWLRKKAGKNTLLMK